MSTGAVRRLHLAHCARYLLQITASTVSSKASTAATVLYNLRHLKALFWYLSSSLSLCCASNAISQAILQFHVPTYWIWTVKYDKCKCMNNQNIWLC